MKILIVGSTNYYAIENFYVKYFRELKVDTEIFDSYTPFIDYYSKSIFNKIVFRLGFSNIYEQINIKLLKTIIENKPEIVFIFKGMEIYPKTLSEIKKLGIKLVNYNPDNPFIFTGKGSGNKNITKSIGLYDLHFTYDSSIKAQLESKYSIPTYLLPFGFELDEEIQNQINCKNEILKVAFVGNPDKDRANFILSLADNGVLIDIFGNDWSSFLNHKNISVFNTVKNENFWKTLAMYRVQLNIMRIHNPASHNMRTFEVPAIGGILLAPSTKDHLTFFKENQEAFFYTDISDCLLKIKEILNLSKEKASEIRNNAQATCFYNGYSYFSRVEYVKSVFEANFPSKFK